MNKTISKPLVIINAIIVFLLLITSALMIFMSNSKDKSLFNYQAKLVIGEKLDDKISDKCLVFAKINDAPTIKNGNYLLYSIEGICYIIKADKVEGNLISYTNKSGDSLTLDATTKDYGGRVTFSSNFCGSILSAFTNKETISLTFILIGGIFIISMLTLSIIYAIQMSKIALTNNKDSEYIEIMELFDEDDEEDADYVFGEDDLIACEITDEYEKKLISDTDIIKKINFPFNKLEYKLNEEVVPAKLVSEDISNFAQTQNGDKVFEKKIKDISTPPYYLVDDDIPSIDNLMNNIDAQFGFHNEEDKDIKIFSIK